MCSPSLCTAYVKKSYFSEPSNKVLNGSQIEQLGLVHGHSLS